MAKPDLIILTGPQGSGNHMFSKIFAVHKDVHGWNELLKQNWIGHEHEPFHKFWLNPELLSQESWDNDYYVTSISCPYQYNGVMCSPKYYDFTEKAKEIFNIQFVIIGRDANILECQEERVRGSVTYYTMSGLVENIIELKYPVHFVSTELVHLYNKDYLRNLSYQLKFPIAHDHKQIWEILHTDPNKKYIKYVEEGAYDEETRRASGINFV